MFKKKQNKAQAIADEDLERNLTQMIRFIEQEGYEKAYEIDIKTEEEFNISKAEFVRTGRTEIDKEYDKKLRKHLVDEKIQISKISQQWKDRAIETKLRALDSVKHAVQQRVSEDMKSETVIIGVLENLVMEGLFKLLENNVTIHCRKEDIKYIEQLMPKFKSLYKQKTNGNLTMNISDKYFKDPLPGIELVVGNGRIQLKNTLNYRIEQIIKSCSPVISTVFFNTHKMRTAS